MSDFKTPLKIVFFLHVIGLVVAAYLTYHHYIIDSGLGGFESFCTINNTFDCDVVNTSKYSMLFGIPIAEFAMAHGMLTLLLCMIAMTSQYSRRDALILMNALGAFSVLTSVFLLAVSVFDLKTTCILCATLYAVNILSLIFSFSAWKRSEFSGGKVSTLLSEFKMANKGRIAGYLVFGAMGLSATHLIASNTIAPMDEDVQSFILKWQSQQEKSVPLGDSFRTGAEAEKAVLTIVEFADFQCPFCAVASKKLHTIVKRYKDSILWVYKNYPLDQACNPKIKQKMHEQSCLAARAAICARKLEKFEELFHKMFENQAGINETAIKMWAKEVGLDENALTQCLTETSTMDELRSDLELAETLGVTSTPTFFVNGRKVEGLLDDQKVRMLMKESLKK